MNAIEFVKKFGSRKITDVIKTGGSNDEIGEVFINLDYACLESVLFEIGAVNFVRKYGIFEAKRVLRDARGCVSVDLWDRFSFETNDLKQIVEAFELVEKAGGLDKAKFKVRLNSAAMLETSKEFKQAIELVEKCHASD